MSMIAAQSMVCASYVPALSPAVIPAGHGPMLRTSAPMMYEPASSMKELIRGLRFTADELDLMRDKTKTGQLILLRHGESVWNDKNRFTGWANVPLTSKGREQALEAATMLLAEEDLHIDACYTSVLMRSVETASICLDAWEQAGRSRPEVYARWRLNERHYGFLTGLNKRDALDRFSATDLRQWRASFDGRPPPMDADHPHFSRTSKRYERLLAARTRREGEPAMSVLSLDDVPLTESLSDTVTRVGSLWECELLPQVQSGKNLLVVGHANCLRALISCIQGNLRDEHLPSLGVPNAVPLVYTFDTETGVLQTRLEGRCYIAPLDAHYLGDSCQLFKELLGAGELPPEADNNGDGVVDFNEYVSWESRLKESLANSNAAAKGSGARGRGVGGGGSSAGRIRG